MWKIANFGPPQGIAPTNYELIGPASALKLLNDRQQFKTRDLSIETLTKCFPNGSQWVEIYHYPLNFTMQKYDIMTKSRQAMFLAQIAHESGELRYKEELSSGSQYEGRLDLGNIYTGDGKRFKGRGLLPPDYPGNQGKVIWVQKSTVVPWLKSFKDNNVYKDYTCAVDNFLVIQFPD